MLDAVLMKTAKCLLRTSHFLATVMLRATCLVTAVMTLISLTAMRETVSDVLTIIIS